MTNKRRAASWLALMGRLDVEDAASILVVSRQRARALMDALVRDGLAGAETEAKRDALGVLRRRVIYRPRRATNGQDGQVYVPPVASSSFFRPWHVEWLT